TPLFEDEMVVVLAPGHPLAERSHVHPRELADEVLLVYPPREESSLVRRVLRPAGVAPRRVVGVPLAGAVVGARAAAGGGRVAPRPPARRLARHASAVGRRREAPLAGGHPSRRADEPGGRGLRARPGRPRTGGRPVSSPGGVTPLGAALSARPRASRGRSRSPSSP